LGVHETRMSFAVPADIKAVTNGSGIAAVYFRYFEVTQSVLRVRALVPT